MLWRHCLNILITNAQLHTRTGTEIVVRDLAIELKRQGHDPQIYSPMLGPIAQEIRDRGIEVTHSARELTRVPDIIHGHHHPQTLTALLRFNGTPSIVVCHDFTSWRDAPLILPRVLRYVAVDERCKGRLEGDPRVPKDRIRVILNAVDLSRFKPRPPLPPRPKRAAIFSNYANGRTHTPAVVEGCREAGLDVEVIGSGSGTSATEPENLLPKYDVVFAKARCALEAMAVGSTVILCDASGLGPLVSSGNFAELRKLNFGAGVLTRPLEPRMIAGELAKYDPQDARSVCERVRREADLVDAVGEWLELYREVLREYVPGKIDHSTELQAIGEYIGEWGFEAGLEAGRLRIRETFRWPKLAGWAHRSLHSGLLRRVLRNT